MKNKSVGAIADSGAFYVGMRANFFDTDAATKSKISFLCVPENYFMDPKVRRSPVRLARSWFSISLSLYRVLSQQKLNINPPYGNVIKRG